MQSNNFSNPKTTQYYLDFDGTLNNIPGNKTVSSPEYQDLVSDSGIYFLQTAQFSDDFVNDLPVTYPPVFIYSKDEDKTRFVLKSHDMVVDVTDQVNSMFIKYFTQLKNSTPEKPFAISISDFILSELQKVTAVNFVNSFYYRSCHFLENMETLLKQDTRYAKYFVSPNTLSFLKRVLESNNEVVIVSNNRKEFICALLSASGLEKSLLDKIVIYDINHHIMYGGKLGTVQFHEQQKQRTSPYVVICDDETQLALDMEKSIKSVNSVSDVKYFSFNPGQFLWSQIENCNNANLLFEKTPDIQTLNDLFGNVITGKIYLLREKTKQNPLDPDPDCFVYEIIKRERENYFVEAKQEVKKADLHALLNGDNPFINPASLLKPNQELASKKYSVTETGQFEKKMSSTPVVNTMRGFLHPEADIKKARASMENNRKPCVMIYRVNNAKEDDTVFTIRSSKNDTKKNHYKVEYISQANKIETILFTSYETDPALFIQSLTKALMEHKDTLYAPIPEVIEELESSKPLPPSSCELIYIHRNKMLLPEEKIFQAEPARVLIISTQTPSESAKSGHLKSATAGGTGMELQRLLSKAPISEPHWFIITGHGGSSKIVGSYTTQFSFDANSNKTQMDVSCTPAEYGDLLISAAPQGLTKLNIMLYVCYGAKNLNNKESFAIQLANYLAEKGYESTIIASKTVMARFAGEYHPNMGEEKDKCLSFRAEGGAANIVVVEGKPNEKPIEKLNQYPDGLFITTEGIGLKKQESAPTISPRPQS